MARERMIDELAQRLRDTADRMRIVGATLYEALMREAAEDRALLDLALLENDPIPMRLFFAVHHLLLDQPERPLADYFRSLCESPRPAAEAYPAFRRYCFEHRTAIQAIMRARTVQTTTVERAACLAPGLARIGSDGEPVSVIEIGCSAGLLLLFDEYLYAFEPGGRLGHPDAALTVHLPVRGNPFTAPHRLPRIARRIGVDLGPVDPADPEAHRWIVANLFPEWVAQRERLRKALDLRARYPLETVTGDAVAVLPALLKAIRGPICIMHSGMMNYLSDDARAALDQTLRDESRRRPVHMVGLDITLPEFNRGIHRMFLRHTRFHNGAADVAEHGHSDLLGQELTWTA